MKKIFCLGFFLITNFNSFSQTYKNNDNTLANTKDYKQKFKVLLDEYLKNNELEKFKAACFLIDNMEIHYSEKFKLVDGNKNKIEFSELEFENSDLALQKLNKIKDSIKIKSIIYKEFDSDYITVSDLKENIELAFTEWKNNPWSKTYNFQTFCEFILPYRSLYEPYNKWRTDYKKLIIEGINNSKNLNDPIDVTTNAILELSEFEFSSKNIDPISLMDPQVMLFRKKGSCADLANLSLFACRSIGLAVTFDFTPHYAASSNRHFWNTIIDTNGKHIPFNGNVYGNPNGGLPLTYNPNHKRIAKVYRFTYSINKNSLAYKFKKSEIPKGFLERKNIIDVTHEYLNTGNIVYEKFSKDSINILFLNVYNNGSWKEIDFSIKHNAKFEFKNLGLDIVYLPSSFNKITTYEPYPILLSKTKEITILKPDYNNTFNTFLTRKNETKTIYSDNNPLEFIEDEEYTLYIWDKKWVKLSTNISSNSGIEFKNLPKNALFKIIPKMKTGYERIFIIDNQTNTISWY